MKNALKYDYRRFCYTIPERQKKKQNEKKLRKADLHEVPSCGDIENPRNQLFWYIIQK